MKKRPFLHIILLVVSVLIIAYLIAALLDTFEPVVSAEEFTSIMEEAGYNVEEMAHPFEQVEVYLVADCGAFEVEYLTHETIAEARLTFAQLRSDLEQLEQVRDKVVSLWSSSGFNSNSFYGQVTSDWKWARMDRIRSTIIFVSTEEENAAYVEDIFEMLGR